MLCITRFEITSPAHQGLSPAVAFVQIGNEWHLQVNRTEPLGPTIVKARACGSDGNCTDLINLGRFEVVDNKTLNLNNVILNKPPTLSSEFRSIRLLSGSPSS
mmetsp:Transcript_41718/g.63736  ORF Transcript_41718/g.63736 Transcript_41718/m.63736 type:complete len:103 (-) Transcript_41718:2607-2915(-)